MMIYLVGVDEVASVETPLVDEELLVRVVESLEKFK